mgnify:CR=1 FL=1
MPLSVTHEMGEADGLQTEGVLCSSKDKIRGILMASAKEAAFRKVSTYRVFCNRTKKLLEKGSVNQRSFASCFVSLNSTMPTILEMCCLPNDRKSFSLLVFPVVDTLPLFVF